jgi:hypothetical protein
MVPDLCRTVLLPVSMLEYNLLWKTRLTVSSWYFD